MPAYRVIIPRAVEKDLDRLAPEVMESCLSKHLPAIEELPLSYPPLKGPYRGLRKYAFRAPGGDYRIIYRVSQQDQLVTVVMVGPREGFYERLERRLR